MRAMTAARGARNVTKTCAPMKAASPTARIAKPMRPPKPQGAGAVEAMTGPEARRSPSQQSNAMRPANFTCDMAGTGHYWIVHTRLSRQTAQDDIGERALNACNPRNHRGRIAVRRFAGRGARLACQDRQDGRAVRPDHPD